jgi:hypothetical protein
LVCLKDDTRTTLVLIDGTFLGAKLWQFFPLRSLQNMRMELCMS